VGKASSQKKVARAATTGGGRTAGTSQSMSWYVTLAVVVLLGVFLVAFSRNEELNRGQAAASPKSTAPLLNSDNWHSTFGVYICDHWLPNLPLFESADGINTLGDGVINIRPYSPQASGTNATLGFFLKAVSSARHGTFKLSSSELRPVSIPGDTNAMDTKDWHNGDNCPDGKAGKVIFTVSGKVQKGNPSTWKFRDGDYLAVGFTSGSTLPSNPGEQLALASTPTGSAASSAPTPTTTTVPPTTTTTVPGSTTTTAAPASTTTVPGSTTTTR
jgi:hypothetical protein